LVFFNTRRRVKPGHVGIYIGDNLFAHASSKSGVTVSSLDYDYYSNRYMGARRVDSTSVLNQ
jgi:cell wall-associated NlpC family hydrolase